MLDIGFLLILTCFLLIRRGILHILINFQTWIKVIWHLALILNLLLQVIFKLDICSHYIVWLKKRNIVWVHLSIRRLCHTNIHVILSVHLNIIGLCHLSMLTFGASFSHYLVARRNILLHHRARNIMRHHLRESCLLLNQLLRRQCDREPLLFQWSYSWKWKHVIVVLLADRVSVMHLIQVIQILVGYLVIFSNLLKWLLLSVYIGEVHSCIFLLCLTLFRYLKVLHSEKIRLKLVKRCLIGLLPTSIGCICIVTLHIQVDNQSYKDSVVKFSK